MNFQKFKLALEKAEEPEIKLPTSVGSSKKQENSRKTSTPASLTMLKPFDCVDHNKLESSSRDGNTKPPFLPPEKTVCRSGSKLEPDMEQWTGSKLGKEYVKAIGYHPVYLTSMKSTSCKIPGWMHKWNQDCWEKYQQPQTHR